MSNVVLTRRRGLQNEVPRELIEPLSHPGVPGTDESMAAVWPVFAQEALRCFLERSRDELVARAPSLFAVLRELVDEPFTLDEAWHPSVGLFIAAPAEQPPAEALALAFALHLGRSRPLPPWRAELSRPMPVRVGTGIVRGATAVSFEGGGRVKVARGGRTARPVPAAFPVDSSEGATVVADGSEPDDSLSMHEADPVTGDELAAFASEVNAAYRYLRRYAPEYLDWVRRAVRVVVPCRAPADMMRSASSNTRPGIVRATLDRPPAVLAEMLVHEASHNYYYAALRVATVDDGSDRRLHFSPAKAAFRPIDKILVAYHAFANVERFYKQAEAAGCPSGDPTVTMQDGLAGQLDDMEAKLRQTPALTTAGAALFEPLAEGRKAWTLASTR